MPGPAPSHHSLGKGKKPPAGAILLPREGRKGKRPRWPLHGPVPSAWAYVWTLPQAVAWERLALHRVVARYALILEAAESGDAPAALLAEARQMEDRLGLSPMAMLRLRWEMADEPEPESDAEVTSLDEYRQLYG